MAKKRAKGGISIGAKISFVLLALAALLTLLQFVFKVGFDIDLGITFFGKDMF